MVFSQLFTLDRWNKTKFFALEGTVGSIDKKKSVRFTLFYFITILINLWLGSFTEECSKNEWFFPQIYNYKYNIIFSSLNNTNLISSPKKIITISSHPPTT